MNGESLSKKRVCVICDTHPLFSVQNTEVRSQTRYRKIS